MAQMVITRGDAIVIARAIVVKVTLVSIHLMTVAMSHVTVWHSVSSTRAIGCSCARVLCNNKCACCSKRVNMIYCVKFKKINTCIQWEKKSQFKHTWWDLPKDKIKHRPKSCFILLITRQLLRDPICALWFIYKQI